MADVEVLGGGQAEYQVLADPARLQGLGIGMDDLAKAVAAGNTVTATGKLEDRHQLYLTVANSRLHGLEDLKALPIRNRKRRDDRPADTGPDRRRPPRDRAGLDPDHRSRA